MEVKISICMSAFAIDVNHECSVTREMRVSRKGSWPLDSCSMVKEICWSIEFNES